MLKFVDMLESAFCDNEGVVVEDNVSVEVLGRITAIAFGRSEPAKKGEEETTDETP